MSEKILYTMDYESMVDLFVRSGLEISPDDPVPEGLLTCFELVEEESGKRIGAAGIVYDGSEYILRCVAVEEAYRGRDYGRQRRCPTFIKSSGFMSCPDRKRHLRRNV